MEKGRAVLYRKFMKRKEVTQHQEGILQKISSVKALSEPKFKLHLLMIRAKTVL